MEFLRAGSQTLEVPEDRVNLGHLSTEGNRGWESPHGHRSSPRRPSDAAPNFEKRHASKTKKSRTLEQVKKRARELLPHSKGMSAINLKMEKCRKERQKTIKGLSQRSQIDIGVQYHEI